MLWLQLASTLLALAAPNSTEQNWEVCLDKADFNYTVGGLLDMTVFSKVGCQIKVGYSGKGDRYEIDLCDPGIHLIYYSSAEAPFQRISSLPATCPKPLFGADFDENIVEIEKFTTTRKRILDSFQEVKRTFGANADKVDLSNPKSFSPAVSDGKVACGQYLLHEYLVNCTAFEAPKPAKK